MEGGSGHVRLHYTTHAYTGEKHDSDFTITLVTALSRRFGLVVPLAVL
ncbi:MAG: hypothetical protein WA624_00760 [Methylocella sp.]